MGFRIRGLSPEPFAPFFNLAQGALLERGVRRVVADARPGYPDRVTLKDAEVGERLLLVNFTHQPAATPYFASHAIFVREAEAAPFDAINIIPQSLRIRPMSLRAFDAAHMMIDADLVDGADLEGAIERMFDAVGAAYLHAHYAKRGCYAARVEPA